MIEFIDCIDLAETCVAYQCLLPVKSSFLAMVEIEGGSLARQVGVRRATLFKKMCFSLDLGIQKPMDTVNIIETSLLTSINLIMGQSSCFQQAMPVRIMEEALKTCSIPF